MNRIIGEDIKKIISSYKGWERLRNKTILITGANGFLPAYLVETLLQLNNVFDAFDLRVIGIVRNKTKAEERFSHLISNSFFEIVETDICADLSVDKKIDFIIHAASQASPKYFGVDPVGTINPNVLGTINLLKLAIKNDVESFLYFSSGEVYGQLSNEDMPIKESTFGYLDPTNVRSCYAESKRMGETLCVSYLHQYGVKAKICRPFHTYGPGMSLDDGRVFADFVSAVVSKKDIVLNSDGSARRAFCYLSDATLAFIMILLDGKDGEAYNVGNPEEEYSMKELANIVISIEKDLDLKLTTAEPVQNNNYLKSPVSRVTPDIEKIRSLGWNPSVSAAEGFDRTIKSFK